MIGTAASIYTQLADRVTDRHCRGSTSAFVEVLNAEWKTFVTVSEGDANPPHGHRIDIAQPAADGFLIRDNETGSLCFIPSALESLEHSKKGWKLGRADGRSRTVSACS